MGKSRITTLRHPIVGGECDVSGEMEDVFWSAGKLYT